MASLCAFIALGTELGDHQVQQVQGTTAQHVIKSGGVTRAYRMSVPAALANVHAIPLIFAFHGHTQTADQMAADTGFDRLPAIIVYPQGVSDTLPSRSTPWESAPYASTNVGEKDSRLVRDILAEVTREYPVDRSRIYAAGMSNGGGFAAKLGCTMPDVFAAIAPVSGAYYHDAHQTRPGGCKPIPTSVMEIHGTNDGVMDYRGKTLNTKHGPYISARELIAEFARRGSCRLAPPPVFDQAPEFDGARQFTWTGCIPGIEVVHYGVPGGVHSWPGLRTSGSAIAQRFPASDLIWDFFLRHHK